MKQKQQGYSYGSGYGGGGATVMVVWLWQNQWCIWKQPGYGSSASGESVEMQAAANYIRNRCFKEALHVLDGISDRTARWYYYSAIANAGSGNNVTAKEHASQAVNMEPSNMEYRQLQQQLEFGGTWYQSRGGEYERPYSGSSGLVHEYAVIEPFM